MACRLGDITELVPGDVLAELGDMDATASTSASSENSRELAASQYLRASLSGNFHALPKMYGFSKAKLLTEDQAEALLDAYRGLYEVSDDERYDLDIEF